ncbi:4180_t:CDS:2 [Paraglomus occultum]|uniref:4180_t:CDS:1 n=1 Tax=Paraglomus occultum TaxID=144539 RepID=A0A9N9G0L3_9GLOM|nr:4180_t:CDS:2 [Paraglomus occultum]
MSTTNDVAAFELDTRSTRRSVDQQSVGQQSETHRSEEQQPERERVATAPITATDILREPRLLRAYNSLSVHERRSYALIDNNNERRRFLEFILDEKKKLRYYLGLIFATLSLVGVIGGNYWAYTKKDDEDFLKRWDNYKAGSDFNLIQMFIIFVVRLVTLLILRVTNQLLNRFKRKVYFISPVVIGVVLAIVGGRTWTVPPVSIPFIGVGLLFSETMLHYLDVNGQ